MGGMVKLASCVGVLLVLSCGVDSSRDEIGAQDQEGIDPNRVQATEGSLPLQEAPGEEEFLTYEGAWFDIDYPKAFLPVPSLPSTTGDGYDSAVFRSPDKEVEFYVFSPQWGGEASDIALDPTTETEISREVSELNGTLITRFSIGARDGSYRRTYEETIAQGETVRWIIGVKFETTEALDRYQEEYLRFKSSLVQYGG